MSRRDELLAWLGNGRPGLSARTGEDRLIIDAATEAVPDLAVELTTAYGCEFATLVVEPTDEIDGYVVHYFFYAPDDATRVEIETRAAPGVALPSISDRIHAADWHEREAEDLYGIHFAGHPFLGDFVLHDNEWPEDVTPMRRSFDARVRPQERGLGENWQPRRLLDEEGALVLPVGPIWGDYHEAGLWLLETPGEQIRQAHTRLFYKYRGVEKIAEGQTPEHALLLAERFSGSAAFAHAWAYCQALEKLAECEVPPRARALRLVFAELERMRYHVAAIAELAGSTALAVGKSMTQEITEKLLRLSGEVCGHRYLFGLIAPGGLAWAPDAAALARLDQGVRTTAAELAKLGVWLARSSSFLDRIEEMGTLTPELADTYGVVGPVARASGRALDLRTALPYGDYAQTPPEIPGEIEGDGYARLRVWLAETAISAQLIAHTLSELPDGPIATECTPAPGGALGWTEAPSGATFHWLRLDAEGHIARWRAGTPGFRNWHAFHRAVEGAAFQDFPIILASFGLSVAENDR
ncbi:MAG: NADH-quinone oxidoreductase subunit C [Gammaproteobacteria bacterium]